jgi:hypothetical protein
LAVTICSSNLDERQLGLAYRRQLHHGQHKIISDGKIIAVAAGKTKNSWL